MIQEVSSWWRWQGKLLWRKIQMSFLPTVKVMSLVLSSKNQQTRTIVDLGNITILFYLHFRCSNQGDFSFVAANLWQTLPAYLHQHTSLIGQNSLRLQDCNTHLHLTLVWFCIRVTRIFVITSVGAKQIVRFASE